VARLCHGRTSDTQRAQRGEEVRPTRGKTGGAQCLSSEMKGAKKGVMDMQSRLGFDAGIWKTSSKRGGNGESGAY